ncbi:hypothetical protein A1O1_01900 [Capronia coronata CBS 617.96]|uniref:ceramidase n=1 Tax=Capronia coronata CBS 617.96 TaxID=1182541 RepID=W9YLS8_9EURO|nr:uncharacterized protein A1O1_01900 [Capronia coronata CBS 617.96]EXJ93508.1 hypothetical protein A1O1_01900 [Capronia coronata CBS 617.96]
MDVKTGEELAYTAPTFTIDLSLDPEDRYKALAVAYKEQLQGLTGLFNSLLKTIGLPVHYHGPINYVAWLLLRGVYSPMETAELRGIAKVTGVPMYLLVSFNVILDILMGCTSGAVKTLEPGQARSESRMLHFRTLDWTMDPLRSIIVQLDFVRSRSASPSEVLARSITYVGFVGCLTGVRQDLSLSLNFRPVHNATTRQEHLAFYFHHLLVLLGYRQSISSLLREYIISDDAGDNHPKTLAEISEELISRRTTAAYLTFSDGVSTIVIEKDYNTGLIRGSDTFIATTNHDQVGHKPRSMAPTPAATEVTNDAAQAPKGLLGLLDESRHRLDCISSKWKARVEEARRHSEEGNTEAKVAITKSELIDWVSAYPTSNEFTHFAAILDAAAGQVAWTKAYRVAIKIPE